jgi:hypothetical protein
MDKEPIFLSSGPYLAQLLYNSGLLWFKIITLTVQTNTGEEATTRGGNVPSISDHKTRMTNPIRQPTENT